MPNRAFLVRALPWVLASYCLASFAHFAHNAEYLDSYPNLPAWLSRAEIYLTWCAITAVGVVGYWLHQRRHTWFGAAVLALYAALGFDGLLHYQRAPMAAPIAMHVTIWTEVVAAAGVLAFVAMATLPE